MFKTNDYWEEEFIEYSDKNLDGIYFDNCTFIKCDFSKAIFYSCKFTECTFIKCDLSLSSLNSCTFNDVIFENSKLLGLSWSKCDEPFDVKFDSCNLSQNSFHMLDLRGMKFINSLIKDTGFEECNLERAVFDNCDLELTSFINNNLKKSNFETSKNYLIDPKQNDIEKAQFSLPEALSFLSLLPIQIK
ncbi:pentapeptide repeat-containing protein [Arcobacter sp. LA11]|uniref:pentapeptide repeat-containing protein n=1 Tax=Arcobacter sp. LA11 TaxID=1898176 RepID=UPI00093340A8|nr:pentapeptide repeat-containing protein [Arcobacter sp. LA11]